MSKKPAHGLTNTSLVSWHCSCGGRWFNDHLKKSGCDGRLVPKTDNELEYERDDSFQRHVEEMRGKGF